MLKEQEIKLLISEEQVQSGIKKLASELNDVYKDEEVYLIGVLKGSVMFMTDLAKRLTMPVKMGFVKLSSYGGGTESSGKIEALEISLPDLNDKNVIIVEDIIDTGLTAKFFIDYLNNKYKTKELKFCALLNKEVRRVVDVKADYYCFDIDDKFIVGYGLDYNECYRNLPYIGYIEV